MTVPRELAAPHDTAPVYALAGVTPPDDLYELCADPCNAVRAWVADRAGPEAADRAMFRFTAERRRARP